MKVTPLAGGRRRDADESSCSGDQSGEEGDHRQLEGEEGDARASDWEDKEEGKQEHHLRLTS